MQKNNKTIATIVVVLLVLFPILFLIYKISGNSTSEITTNENQAQQYDISALENNVKNNPNFDNLINLSIAYINSNMPAKSIDHLLKAIELNPTNPIPYSNISLAFTMTQQYNKGIEYGKKAIAIDSTFQLAKNNLKWAMDEYEKVLNEIQLMEQTEERNRNTEFYNLLGLNFLKIENYDRSIEIWNNTLAKEPNNVAALTNIGIAYMMKKEFDQAITHFKKAVDLAPEDQLSKNNLTWALEEKEKLK